jgi:Cellulase (glycosyl hydrolase family 5)
LKVKLAWLWLWSESPFRSDRTRASCKNLPALVLLAVLVGASIVSVPFSRGGSEPSPSLQTAIVDSVALGGPDSARAFNEVPATGATFVRLILDWRVVAPQSLPPVFDPSNPGDAAYQWAGFDQQVSAAASHGLQTIIDITDAPLWARAQLGRGGPYKPDPVALGQFARAAAIRYGGQFQALPRVRYWQLLNEPNLAENLRPQFVGSVLYSPIWYRKMLNAFADAVHSVHSDNSVIAGGTAPFTTRAGKRSSWGPGPLLFLRSLLCLSKQLKPTCSQRARFDIWAHHPYTSGGPNHHANNPDDVSLGDLPRMKAVLDAGVATGHIVSRQKMRFWVTEFSWDTNPPDPNAVPIALQTRWVSEALYTMWKAGVSLVTWYSLKDQPLATSFYQSGLYFLNGKPKPSLRAFRFPFVAYPNATGIDVWGRTPSSRPGTVAVEQEIGGAWQRLGSLKTNAFGIFSAHYESKAKGALRAQLVGSTSDVSQPYSLKEPPDHFYRPFGEPS